MAAQPRPEAGRRIFLALLGLLGLLAVIVLFAGAASAGAPTKTAAETRSTGGGTPSPSPTGCIQTWKVVDSPSPYGYSDLVGVDALSANDVWAVGFGLVDHWDGTAWTAMTNTLPLTSTTELYGVSAVSTNDVWAVGIGDGVGHYTGVIIHWNGSSWSNMPNPDPADETGLYGVKAISSNDVWAVGYRYDFGSSQPLAMHWDGTAWTIVTTPAPSGAYKLLDVAALATNDVWAVGGVGGGGSASTIIMHWDGSAWSISPAPFQYDLAGVVAIAHNDVWASGSRANGNSYDAVILHWDGTAWSVSTTLPGQVLYRMAATSSHDIWAVGRGDNTTLVMHWDGSAWSTVQSPRPYPFAGELWGVVAISPTEAWAVGDTGSGNGNYASLTIRYSRWCPTPIGCSEGWNAIDGPNPGSDTNFLFAASASSAGDIWAVGAFDGGQHPMSQRWNGSYWSYVPMPGLPGGTGLFGLKAIAPNNVRAVGYVNTGTGNGRAQTEADPRRELERKSGRPLDAPGVTYQTVIARWDGQSWTRVPSPNPGGTNFNGLYSIDGVAANDLWAVGYYYDGSSDHTLILHWNGSTWTQAASPAGALSGVAALSSEDVWAVGSSGTYPTSTTLVLHWDGQAWNSVASPNPGSSSNDLAAVAAVSAGDIWAAGSYSNTSGGGHVLTMHWDGTAWTAVAAPGSAQLQGLSALAANDVWAVGLGGSAQSTILHWDGTVWTEASHPGPGPGQISELYGVVAVSPNEVWTVGDIGYYQIRARIERWVGSCVTPSPTATLTSTPTATATATPRGCGAGWVTVDSPDPNVGTNWLFDVAALSRDDAWAVGFSGNSVLTKHWDGTSWSNVPAPAAPSASALWGVSAVAPDDVWAAGYIAARVGAPSGPPFRQNSRTPEWNHPLLAMHWNGQEWNVVPVPTSIHGTPYAVKAFAANDVWVAGTYENNGLQTLLIHWDGTTWTQMPSPQGELFALAGIASNDMWAVGTTGEESYGASLTLHWDGTQWSTVPSPNPSVDNDVLYGVAAVASNDVWAVGFWSTHSFPSSEGSLAFHWDGSSWSSVQAPTTRTILIGASAAASNDVWAVEQPGNAVHWNGSNWTEVPANSGPNTLLYRSASAPGNIAWMVGGDNNSGGGHTVIEMYNDPCQTVTVTPTPSATYSRTATATRTVTAVATVATVGTATPSSTRTTTSIPPTATGTAVATSAPTGTTPQPTRTAGVSSTATAIATAAASATGTGTPVATSTATVCPVQFTDVPTGSTFYPYIRCLACRGIVSGYLDGTFKPNNNVTRGQLSKIVSNAAGFSDAQPTQMFQDVPVGSTFQVYIGRLASRGYIGGYPCGGPGEPCGQGNLPYFRPNNNATRGQISKIVSNAAGFSDPPGAQSFEDVAPGSTFYDYVERLASRGVMSGYACGGAGEPCGQGNLPYFRPNNDATRGQTSKIVSNTFFPDCQTPARK